VIYQSIRTDKGHTGVVNEQPGIGPAEASDETATADEPVLPDVSADDRDEGWGEDPHAGRRDEQWYRRERPPHHE
jgi:hypothetical protein